MSVAASVPLVLRYLLYIAANYYPTAYLMYPGTGDTTPFLSIECLFVSSSSSAAAALVGLAAAPLWTSKCSYLTDTGAVYANAKLVHKDLIVNRFFGIFFMFFQSGSRNIVNPYVTVRDSL